MRSSWDALRASYLLADHDLDSFLRLCRVVLSIAFTKFIDWRRLNIEQSYGLRAPYLDGAYCLTQCTVTKKYHVLKTITVYFECSIHGNHAIYQVNA